MSSSSGSLTTCDRGRVRQEYPAVIALAATGAVSPAESRTSAGAHGRTSQDTRELQSSPPPRSLVAAAHGEMVSWTDTIWGSG